VKPAIAPQGWTVLGPVGQDASTRRYSRLEKNGRRAILMDCSHGETPGHSLDDYVRIAEWINDAGLKAPEIFEREKDYLIVEDFGDVTFKKALQKLDANELYAIAADVLKALRQQKTLPQLPDYYSSNVHKGHRRVIDWYVPTVRRKKNEPGLAEEYLSVWSEIEKNAPAKTENFVHADFHVENLMYLPGGQGVQRCGILDFQGAMLGPASYDLANLLEDVRVDVPTAIRKKYQGSGADYRILATQFHCRVVGQFIKLAAKDHKTGYLQYIPRTQAYIRDALQEPLLKPLASFFEKHGISFTAKPDLTDIKSLVAPDAF
jgi:aminoglycoside/choline kinase family phosphotransferase